MASTNKGKNKSKKLVKPFLKWAGGKRQLVPVIRDNHLPKNYNPNRHTYYEPFLGGGAILFALQPKKAVINDCNAELMNCYKVVRDSLDELIKDLNFHRNEKDYYYAVRNWDRDKSFDNKTSVQRASRIIFLNKTCYNGLFRVNSQGQFNVPFGRYKKPNILEEAVLRAVSQYLNTNQVELLNLDFKNAVQGANKGDFIYFDPPYDPISDSASFTGYDVNKFNRDEQRRLKETVDELNRRGCKVLLSNAYTDFIVDLYRDYNQTRVSAIRAINSNPSKRGRVDEILVKNYE